MSKRKETAHYRERGVNDVMRKKKVGGEREKKEEDVKCETKIKNELPKSGSKKGVLCTYLRLLRRLRRLLILPLLPLSHGVGVDNLRLLDLSSVSPPPAPSDLLEDRGTLPEVGGEVTEVPGGGGKRNKEGSGTE